MPSPDAVPRCRPQMPSRPLAGPALPACRAAPALARPGGGRAAGPRGAPGALPAAKTGAPAGRCRGTRRRIAAPPAGCRRGWDRSACPANPGRFGRPARPETGVHFHLLARPPASRRLRDPRARRRAGPMRGRPPRGRVPRDGRQAGAVRRHAPRRRAPRRRAGAPGRRARGAPRRRRAGALARFRGMPPRGNPAGPEGRGRTAPRRNMRRKIPAPEGREAPSDLAALAGTAGKDRAFAGRVAVGFPRDPGWDMLDPGPWAGPDRRAFDALASGLARPPGCRLRQRRPRGHPRQICRARTGGARAATRGRYAGRARAAPVRVRRRNGAPRGGGCAPKMPGTRPRSRAARRRSGQPGGAAGDGRGESKRAPVGTSSPHHNHACGGRGRAVFHARNPNYGTD